jgi:hypothetical protein
MRRAYMTALVAGLLTTSALAVPHCEEYAFKSHDDLSERLFEHEEVASIEVGDYKQLSDVIVRSKLLVKRFSGVEISIDVVSPDDVIGLPQDTVVLKKEHNGNPNFLLDHVRPLKLEVVWRDDAPYNLYQALEQMTFKERQEAKTDFVQVVAKPDVSLKNLAHGISTVAGQGGSKGTWEFRVANNGLRASRREHVKLMNWDLTLCFEETEALANESHDSGPRDQLTAANSAEADNEVVFRRRFGSGTGLLRRLRPGYQAVSALVPARETRTPMQNAMGALRNVGLFALGRAAIGRLMGTPYAVLAPLPLGVAESGDDAPAVVQEEEEKSDE